MQLQYGVSSGLRLPLLVVTQACCFVKCAHVCSFPSEQFSHRVAGVAQLWRCWARDCCVCCSPGGADGAGAAGGCGGDPGQRGHRVPAACRAHRGGALASQINYLYLSVLADILTRKWAKRPTCKPFVITCVAKISRGVECLARCLKGCEANAACCMRPQAGKSLDDPDLPPPVRLRKASLIYPVVQPHATFSTASQAATSPSGSRLWYGQQLRWLPVTLA